MVRQVADEAHRVAQQHGPPARQLPAAGPRVERGEEQVLGEDVGAGQGVQERALAGVGVADQRNGHLRPPRGDLALAAMLDGVELLPQIADPLLGQAAVDLQLLLARAAQAHAALGLPREVRPHPLQARHLVFQLGQLDRQAGLVRLARLAKMSRINSVRSRTFRPVAFSRLRVCPGLRSLSKKITSAISAWARAASSCDLALAQVGCRVGRFAALRELADDVRAGGLGETFQFFQRDQLGTAVGEKDADEDRRLARHALGAADLIGDGLSLPQVRKIGRDLASGRFCRTAAIMAQPRLWSHQFTLLSVLFACSA